MRAICQEIPVAVSLCIVFCVYWITRFNIIYDHTSHKDNEWTESINIYWVLLNGCKPGKVVVPSLVPTLATFSLTSHHLLPFKSIIWVVKSAFIAQVGCVLQEPRLRPGMRCVAIFGQVQSTEFICKISHPLFLQNECNFPKVHKPRPY